MLLSSSEREKNKSRILWIQGEPWAAFRWQCCYCCCSDQSGGKEPATCLFKEFYVFLVVDLQEEKYKCLGKMHGHIDLGLQRTCLEQVALCFFFPPLLLNIYLFILHFPPDQQRLVFHFTSHLHVLVPPVRNVLQQWHLLNMDSFSCSG